MVRPEYKDQWNNEVKPRTFVVKPDCVIQQRTPGLWKEEYSITDGSAIFLSPKCYSIKDNTLIGPKTTKFATKGIHVNDDALDFQHFFDSLYSNQLIHLKQANLRMLRKEKQMALIETTKSALNNVFTKLRVSSDNVTISPLTLNNQYM